MCLSSVFFLQKKRLPFCSSTSARAPRLGLRERHSFSQPNKKTMERQATNRSDSKKTTFLCFFSSAFFGICGCPHNCLPFIVDGPSTLSILSCVIFAFIYCYFCSAASFLFSRCRASTNAPCTAELNTEQPTG